MHSKEDHIQSLAEIRAMMEKSSRFISLSGLAGVFAGLFALAGAAAAYVYMKTPLVRSYDYPEQLWEEGSGRDISFIYFFFADGFVVLTLSLFCGFWFSRRKAKKQGQKFWSSVSKRLLMNLAIPLVAGGFFCLALVYHGMIELVAPATLIFYGMALINGSKYTLEEVRYLGLSEILLGLAASFFPGFGLIFWAVGFGVLHIVYGLAMYNKYERRALRDEN